MTEFILYGRPGCHLCEAMADALAAVLPAGSYRLHTVDVDNDPETERRYGARLHTHLAETADEDEYLSLIHI